MLIHPTYPEDILSNINVVEAVYVANKLLRENGMGDIEAYPEGTRETPRFYVCSYRSKLDPKLASGGGATLVVRKSDSLAGMVFARLDWLDPEDTQEKALSVAINKAFDKFSIRSVD